MPGSAECFAAKASPSVTPKPIIQRHCQVVQAIPAASAAISSVSASGRSVMTSGMWALKVGSIARKARSPAAQAGPSARQASRPTPRSISAERR